MIQRIYSKSCGILYKSVHTFDINLPCPPLPPPGVVIPLAGVVVPLAGVTVPLAGVEPTGVAAVVLRLRSIEPRPHRALGGDADTASAAGVIFDAPSAGATRSLIASGPALSDTGDVVPVCTTAGSGTFLPAAVTLSRTDCTGAGTVLPVVTSVDGVDTTLAEARGSSTRLARDIGGNTPWDGALVAAKPATASPVVPAALDAPSRVADGPSAGSGRPPSVDAVDRAACPRLVGLGSLQGDVILPWAALGWGCGVTGVGTLTD